jgi:uncharacterized protein (TIGR02588 family)
MPTRKSDKKTGKPQTHAIPIWEWAVALFGLALLLGSLGLITYEALAGDASPPEVQVEMDSVQRIEDGYRVTFRVLNQGGSAAAGVMVLGELVDGAGSVEASQTIIDYVPAHSHRRGGLFFTRDPEQFELRLRATGYQAP